MRKNLRFSGSQVGAEVFAFMPAWFESSLQIIPCAFCDDPGARGAAGLALDSWIPALTD